MENNKNESLGLSLDEEIEAGLAAREEMDLQEGKKWDSFKRGIKKVAKATGRGVRTAAETLGGGALGFLVSGGNPIGAAIGAGAGLASGVGQHAYGSIKDNDKEIDESIQYSDYDLLNFLDESGYEPSLQNLNILKEGLADGSIILTEDEEKPEGIPAAEKELDSEHLDAEKESGKAESILAQDSKEKEKKPAIVKESKILHSHSEEFLKSYLTEDCGMSQKEFVTLTEDEKVDSLKELAKSIAMSITSKMEQLDTSAADKSRGDIKLLKILPDLQTAITQLEAVIERADQYNPDCKKYIGVVIKSILYLNQYSAVFKEAYRNKKTLLILKYETIVMSVVSATAYLISQIVDFRSQTLGMKPVVEIEEIAPLKTLKQFVKSVDSGEFKIVTNDVSVLREYYKELPVEKLSSICEAGDIIGMVTDGLKSIYDGLDKNKITQLLYKVTGVIVLLLSVRDSVYSLSRMKTRFSDMAAMISNFANVNLGGGLKSLVSFSTRYIPDIESASEMATNEISDDNRKLSTQLRAIKAAPVIDNPEPIDIAPESPVGRQETIPSTNDIFSF